MWGNSKLRPALAPLALGVAMACAVAGCGKKDDAAVAAPGATPAATPAPTPESVVSATVTAMGADQLRASASKAYNENRLYAPAGDNALEYYLALRDKQPGDAGASSALSDLLPMTVIATEQAISREDFGDAKRLSALIAKADANHPALARLKDSIGKNEVAATARVENQRLTADEEAKRKADLAKQREDDQKKLQEQQRQQVQAQQQQAQAQEAAAQREAAQREVAQREAAQREAAQREAAQRQQAASTPAATADAPRQAAASSELRPVSQPGPRFPANAQRAGATANVQIEFTVGTDGSVSSARVVSNDAPRQFQRDFDREALAAIKRWRFQPVSQATTSRRTVEFKQ